MVTQWRNGSGGRAAGLMYTCQARGHGFDSRCLGLYG